MRFAPFFSFSCIPLGRKVLKRFDGLDLDGSERKLVDETVRVDT